MWKLRDFAPGDGVRAGAHLPEHTDHAWLDIAVPGDIHRTLALDPANELANNMRPSVAAELAAADNAR